MIQLYQAEWCPFSSIVRERLTELGVDYTIKQVAPFPPDREALKEATGVDTIPVVVFDDGRVVGGDTHEILQALDAEFTAWEWESGHQEQHARH